MPSPKWCVVFRPVQGRYESANPTHPCPTTTPITSTQTDTQKTHVVDPYAVAREDGEHEEEQEDEHLEVVPPLERAGLRHDGWVGRPPPSCVRAVGMVWEGVEFSVGLRCGSRSAVWWRVGWWRWRAASECC